MLYHREPDHRGILQLCTPKDPPPPITLIHGDTEQAVGFLQASAGTCYLGLYLTTDCNTHDMETHLMTKATLYTKAFHRTPMNQREARVLYRSCFLPAMAYPLPASWLPDAFFDKVHQMTTLTILNKMGYHRNLPRNMVFAPKAIGGVSLCNLKHEMEVQQILILLCHMHSKTPLGRTMEILVCYYQLWAGIQQPVLEDTQPCPWVPDKWLSRLRRTLNEHNIKIYHNSWSILPLRQHDVYIMEAVDNLGFTQSQLEQINACRMHLQITTLAEMSDHTGMHLLPQVMTPRGHAYPQGLESISTSTLKWPRVCNLTTKTWNFWT